MTMTPLSSTSAVIQRVILRTPDASRLSLFYKSLLELSPSQAPAEPRSISMLHPRSGEALLILNEDPQSRRPPAQAPGLFHTAFLFDTASDWRAAVKRALTLTDGHLGASDHGVSLAVYLADPDGNGIELTWDKPVADWPWHGDRIRMMTRPLTLREILLSADPSPPQRGDFQIGHLHLQVANLQTAAAYQANLGLHVTQSDYPGAVFMAHGGYHHHLAINTWRSAPQTIRPDNAVGLIGWEMTRLTHSTPEIWRDPIGFEVRLLAKCDEVTKGNR